MFRNKKGDLALSVNAIVIVVISFVVLGLALSLTRGIFKFASERAESVIPLTELEAKPTPENPISISDTVSITKGGKQTLSVGYYNTNDFPATDATFSVAECIDSAGTGVDIRAEDTTVKVTSPYQTVASSGSVGYKLILGVGSKLPSGTYICTLAVHSKTEIITLDSNSRATLPERAENKLYETKQFFLKVTA